MPRRQNPTREARDRAEHLDLPDQPIPVSVLTGFPGSAKTTVRRHLLAQADMDETAVIVDELGEIGLDAVPLEAGPAPARGDRDAAARWNPRRM